MPSIASNRIQLKIGDTVEGNETFLSLGKLTLSNMSLTNQIVQNSDISSGAWKTLQNKAGIKQIDIMGNYVINSNSIEAKMQNAAFSNTATSFELHFGNGQKIAGKFIIKNYTQISKTKQKTECKVSLTSSGEITYS